MRCILNLMSNTYHKLTTIFVGGFMILATSFFAFGAYFLFLKITSNSIFPPPLNNGEEKEYFKLAKKGDENARAKLIEHNLRLVAHIAKKFASSGYEQDDLISIGSIGLIKAIDSYNPDSGTRFATYAGKCLQNEILMYFRAQKKLASETLLSDAVDTDKDGNPLTYMDIICCEDNILEEIELKINSKKAIKAVNELLDEREKEIIVLRYGLAGTPPRTQREIASKLGISRSYVSRIEKSALNKLRTRF